MHSEDQRTRPVSQNKAGKVDGRARLMRFEEQWRDRQPMLEQRGYMLRPRYRPGWIPSWHKDPSLNRRDCEDAILAPVRRS